MTKGRIFAMVLAGGEETRLAPIISDHFVTVVPPQMAEGFGSFADVRRCTVTESGIVVVPIAEISTRADRDAG